MPDPHCHCFHISKLKMIGAGQKLEVAMSDHFFDHRIKVTIIQPLSFVVHQDREDLFDQTAFQHIMIISNPNSITNPKKKDVLLGKNGNCKCLFLGSQKIEQDPRDEDRHLADILKQHLKLKPVQYRQIPVANPSLHQLDLFLHVFGVLNSFWDIKRRWNALNSWFSWRISRCKRFQ